MPKVCSGIRLVNVPSQRVLIVAKHHPESASSLAEVLKWVDPDERSGGTVFFAGIFLASRTWRIEWCALAEVAFDGNHLVSFACCRQRRCCETEHSLNSCHQAWRHNFFRNAWHH